MRDFNVLHPDFAADSPCTDSPRAAVHEKQRTQKAALCARRRRCDENTRFLWSKRYVYQFGSESCRTKSGEGDKTVSIPFPAGLSADSDYEDVTRSRKIRCDFRTLADYYKDCENAEITDSAVTLHCGGFDAVLTVNAEHILTVDVRMTE